MKPISFVHAADLHIDSPFKGVTASSPQIASRLRSATMESFNKIIDLCIEQRADFLIVSGDVYDGADRSIQAQLEFLEGLRKLASHNIQSFIAHGNHDHMSGCWAKLDFEGALATIFPVRPTSYVVKKNGEDVAALTGMSYPEQREERNLAKTYQKELESLPADLFKIAVLHCNVGDVSEHDNYAPCTLDDLTSQKFDYWALGHIHSRKVLFQNPWVVYPGNSQGRSMREQGEKGCYLVKVDENGNASLTFQATDRVRWAQSSVSISDIATVDQLERTLLSSLEELRHKADGRPVICRITLTGRGELYDDIKTQTNRDDIVARCRVRFQSEKQFCWLEELEFQCKPDIDLEEARKRQDLLAFLLREASDIRANNSEEILRSQLQPLLEHRLGASLANILSPAELKDCLEEAELACVDLLEYD